MSFGIRGKVEVQISTNGDTHVMEFVISTFESRLAANECEQRLGQERPHVRNFWLETAVQEDTPELYRSFTEGGKPIIGFQPKASMTDIVRTALVGYFEAVLTNYRKGFAKVDLDFAPTLMIRG